MDRKDYLAAFLILPLVIAEIAEGTMHRFLALRETGMEAASSNTLTPNPHTHFDIESDPFPTTVVPMFASGGRHDYESFRLHIVPARSGFLLIGHPFGQSPDGGQPQLMFGHSENLDDLMETLASGLGLPTPQIEAVRRTALDGRRQEIGGYSPSAIRLFSRAALESIGMNFRPLDS